MWLPEDFWAYFPLFSFNYHMTLCVSVMFAVARYPSVCPSVCHISLLYPHNWRYCQTFLMAWLPQNSSFWLYACTETVCKWLRRNTGHLGPNLNCLEISCLGDARSFLRPLCKGKTVCELKVALERTWDSFLQIQLSKISGVLDRDWGSIWRLIEDVLSICHNSESVHTYVSWDNVRWLHSCCV